MSEDTHASGAITITPPITWAEVWDLKGWLSIESHQRDAVLRVLTESTNTPTGITTVQTCDAIVPGHLIGYNLLQHVQEIVDRFGEGHAFGGHLDCSYAREDAWRIVVRDGKAVEVRPTWPEDQPAYVPAVDHDGEQLWRAYDGQVHALTAEQAGNMRRSGWRRLYVVADAVADAEDAGRKVADGESLRCVLAEHGACDEDAEARAAILARLVPILEECGSGHEAEGVTEATVLDEIGIDSLARMEVVVAAEETFAVRIPDARVEKIATVGDLVDTIEKAKA